MNQHFTSIIDTKDSLWADVEERYPELAQLYLELREDKEINAILNPYFLPECEFCDDLLKIAFLIIITVMTPSKAYKLLIDYPQTFIRASVYFYRSVYEDNLRVSNFPLAVLYYVVGGLSTYLSPTNPHLSIKFAVDYLELDENIKAHILHILRVVSPTIH